MADDKPSMHSYLRYASVGIEMGLSVVAGLLIGKFLDDQLGTDPWLTLVFLLFGSAAGFRALIRAARRMQRDFQSQDPPAGSGKGQDGKRKDDA